MKIKYIKYVLIFILLLLIQSTIIPFITLEEISADLILIGVVYLAIKEGQIQGMLWGFGAGLMFDLVTGIFIGLSCLTKTIAGFVAGYFFNENKTKLTLSSYRFVMIVMLSSIIHNTIYFLLFAQGSSLGVIKSIGFIGTGSTLYTGTIALIPMFVFARKYRI